ncbi:MAG: Capsule biosynthesis protein CapB [Firmicutes bacterium ADurb.BinA052]|jgi:poly-gamma-glutamate synthase PgsB/CapB|nr:MAG: Capsule biosynthesis protein CapB [Firmicutes bacterium ADurb.BinA052]
MYVFAVLCICLLGAGVIENFIHQRRLERIPVRVQVNGTRGKSTTTRLIAAGLRAGGLRVIAKTTGTAARLIMEDGSELPIARRGGRANISEQMRIIRLAARRGVDAVVLECMALEPENQWVIERRMVRSTIGVITNARRDHLDVMGPTAADVAEVLALSAPYRGHLVTAEREWLPVFERAAAKAATHLHAVDGSDVPDRVNAEFEYVSFKENVACALRACELAGVPRESALAGMARAAGDPGSMTVRKITLGGADYVFGNAFAANDRDSTLDAWRLFADRARAGSESPLPTAVIMNNRSDRLPRIGEMAELVAREIRPSMVFLVGESGRLAARTLRRAGMPAERIVDLTKIRDAQLAIDRIAGECRGGAHLLGIGNTRGAGQSIADYFLENGAPL